MPGNPAVQIIVNDRGSPREGSSVELRLDVLGRPVCATLQAPAVRLALADLVPAARQLSSRLTDAAAEQLDRRGARPRCRKGCDSCCRYLVPVSAAEALCLYEETMSLKGPLRVKLLAANLQAARRILKASPPPVGEDQTPAGLAEIARWYSALEVDCPFLDRGACAVYETRPLACREFFAYCPTAEGPAGRGEEAREVRLPFSVATALSELSAEFEPSWPKAIALPLAMVWAADTPNRTAPGSWPASVLLARLAALLHRQAAEAAGQMQPA